jgi:hypothetical protein
MSWPCETETVMLPELPPHPTGPCCATIVCVVTVLFALTQY